MAKPKPQRSLRAFVEQLEAAGELVRITEEVDPVLEITEIADRVSKSKSPNGPSDSARKNDPRFFDRGGPALLFENVKGSDLPVLINAYGSYRRMELALSCDGFDEIGGQIAELVKPEPPRGLGEAVAKAKQFAPLLKIGPKRSKKRPPCQEVIQTGDEIDLTRWPILRCWPLDGDFESVGYPAGVNDGVPGLGHPDFDDAEWDERYRGRYITLAGIHTIHADEADEPKPKTHNIGMYRVQLLGKNRVAMHWHIHHDGANHWRSWKKAGKPMPVAIVLGGEAVLPYGATAPLPPGISELLMAGFLNQGGIKLARAHTVPLWIPANAEMVIEGYVRHDAGPIGYDPRQDGAIGEGAVFEGPFGDHTGFYSMPDRYPIVEVSAVTRRSDAIYPTTVVGLPPQEDYFLGKATERLFLPLLQVLIPDIEDYDLPMFGAFHNCAFLRIEKHYALQGRRVMHSVWGAGQMAWTKTIFVVDDSTDVHDTMAVLRAASSWCDPARDLELVNGPLDILDHAAPRLGGGMKLGFDCTPAWPGEEVNGVSVKSSAWAAPNERTKADFVARVRELPAVIDAGWPEETAGWLFVGLDKRMAPQGYAIAERIAQMASERGGPRFVVVLDSDVWDGDVDRAMFHWCANTDASRDMVRSDAGSGAGSGSCVAFDATAKLPGDARHGQPVRAWPPIIEMDERMRETVDRRWAEYGLDGGLGSVER